MAERNRWTTRNPDDPYDPVPVDPGPDILCCSWCKPKLKPSDRSIEQNENTYGSDRVDPGSDDCCCPWLKPKSKPSNRSKKQNVKTEDTNREGKGKEYSIGGKKPDERSDAPGVQQWQGTVDIPKGSSKGSNKNTWSDNMQPNDSSGVSVETTKNGAVNEFKGKQVWTHDQENSDGIPRNMKPSPQNQKISSPGQGHLWEDNKQEEIKKEGKNTGPNSTNVTKSMDGVYSSEEKQRSNIIPKEEDNDGGYEGTRPDSTKNKGNHGGTRSDPTKSSTFENDRIKNRHEGILEDHHKAVHKQEYNHGIHRDTRPDLTKKESSGPEQAAGVQKREGKQKETN
ncbi:hypothetical protein QYF36_027367 [Acer negundo]|nr:hypothetical protein QYF36_027367 [Acer negundo]